MKEIEKIKKMNFQLKVAIICLCFIYITTILILGFSTIQKSSLGKLVCNEKGLIYEKIETNVDSGYANENNYYIKVYCKEYKRSNVIIIGDNNGN